MTCPGPCKPTPVLDWRDVELLRQSILGFLRGRCRDVHVAEDLTHETLLRAARFRAGRESSPRHLTSWAVQIAANVHRDHLRREFRYHLVPDDDPQLQGLEAREARDPEDGFVRIDGVDRPLDEVLLALRRALPGLTQRDRAALAGFYGEGGSTVRAARAARATPGNVKVRLFRARRRLEVRLRRALATAASLRLLGVPVELPEAALEA